MADLTDEEILFLLELYLEAFYTQEKRDET